jgi:hypothetical protein
MSVFDDLETAANDIIIANDFKNGGLYRLAPNTGADGFNGEYEYEPQFLREIRIAIAKGNTEFNSKYIGTTTDKDVQTNDVIQIVDPRGKLKRYVVTQFTPTNEHTLLDLDEARINGA